MSTPRLGQGANARAGVPDPLRDFEKLAGRSGEAVHPKARLSLAESGGDSQAAASLIQDAGWSGGQQAWLDPIEQLFAKLKALLRKAAERTIEATWKRIGQLLGCFTAQECANYLANAGYASA